MSIFDALNVVLYLANVVFTSRKNKKIPVAPEHCSGCAGVLFP